jgi:hypothetical protein
MFTTITSNFEIEEESRMGHTTCWKCRAPVLKVLLPVARIMRQVVRVVRPFYVHYSSERSGSRLSLEVACDSYDSTHDPTHDLYVNFLRP